MTEPLGFRQIGLATPQLFVDGRQFSGSLGDSLLERLCNPLMLAGASSLLQSDYGLVGRDAQKKPFDIGREITPARAGNQHAGFVLEAQGERRDRDLALSGRIWNHATRCGLSALQPAAERLTDLLWLNSGVLAVSRPEHFDWSTVTRVAQPRVREIEAQHGEKHVEQSANDLR
jgi:hypothetical protein